MNDSETFLSRWLRLKRESEAAPPHADTPSPTPFDPASLPPLDSIVADTDMQQFLHKEVPAELTRAALRNAWTADPAVRDFVGIAENQWNFNDHACIPGFGALEAADYLAIEALGSLTNVPQEIPHAAEQPAQSELTNSEPLGEVKRAGAPSSVEKTADNISTAGPDETATPAQRAGGETGSIAEAPRSHGSALPR